MMLLYFSIIGGIFYQVFLRMAPDQSIITSSQPNFDHPKAADINVR